MKVKDRDEAKQILQEIDELSESAILMNDTIERLNEGGGKTKLTVYIDGETIVTELGENTAVIAMREIVSAYNNEIAVRKSKLEEIIRNTIVKLN